jgi:hypothetical protein
MTFYWALGGKFGAATIGTWAEQAVQAREPKFLYVLWLTGLLKVFLVLMPLALVRNNQASYKPRLLYLKIHQSSPDSLQRYAGPYGASFSIFARFFPDLLE